MSFGVLIYQPDQIVPDNRQLPIIYWPSNIEVIQLPKYHVSSEKVIQEK